MTEEVPPIWHRNFELSDLSAMAEGTVIEHLGIEYTEVGPNYLKGSMPVDRRTVQPYGILHGGATVVLTETLGSVAANLCVDSERLVCVGLDISANHIRQVTSGTVVGTAVPEHLGRQTHIWGIRVEDEAGRLIHVSRLTMVVLERTRA